MAPLGFVCAALNIRRDTTTLGFVCCCTLCKKSHDTFRSHTSKSRRTAVDQDPETDVVGTCTVDMHAHKSHFIRNLQVKSVKTPPSTCELRPRHRICGRLRSRHAHAQEPLFTEIYRRKAAEQLSTKTPRQTLWEPAHSTCTRTRATLYGTLQVKCR